MKLSTKSALICCHSKEGFVIPEPLSNIKLNFFMPEKSEDVYAKVLSKKSEKCSFYIHFTAISLDVKKQIEELCFELTQKSESRD